MRYTVHTTHPETDVVKRVCPRKADETERQREKRLGAQAAANRLRVRNNHDGTFTVPSQRKGADGRRPLTEYTVHVLSGGELACTCDWAVWHNGRDDAACAHTSQVAKYIARNS